MLFCKSKNKSVSDAGKPNRYASLIKVPIALSTVFTVLSAAILLLSPWLEKHVEWLHTAVEKLGPAVAGFWVLSASLLTLSAVGFTLQGAADDAATKDAEEAKMVRELCIAEIKAFWNRMNVLELHNKLTRHKQLLEARLAYERSIAGQQVPANNPNAPHHPDLFRRSLGDNWFVITKVDPMALTKLGSEACALYVGLAAHVFHLVGRTSYINRTSTSTHPLSFWVDYHSDTLQTLNEVKEMSVSMLGILDADIKDQDILTYKF